MSKDSVYVIYDKEDDCLWHHKAKIGWISSGAAKNAWNLGKKIKFDNQDRYVVVCVNELLVKSLIEEKSNDNE